MEKKFGEAYASLNAEQKTAVKTIDGPVLVIAGPGTGKTQLLSTRVGYILQKTDAQPQNILALTFTEAAVDAMRQRLTEFLGQAAYDISISTYHAFGSDLLRRYPEYSESYDFQPADEVAADSIIREILEAEPYSNPLKSADTYARDLRKLISDSKRALLSPNDLTEIAQKNSQFIDKASIAISETFANFTRVDKTSIHLFAKLAEKLAKVVDSHSIPAVPLKKMALEQLSDALTVSGGTNTKPLTVWKNNWLAKDSGGNFVLAGGQANRRLSAAAEIYAKYQQKLKSRKLYDYDDMILRAIKALEENPDFKYTIAEQYLYIMLDEFQDTNAAQLRIVELLTDNPVNEGRPNVLAVGDDDQAIYAFQGSDHANMYRFSQIYKDVKLINLRQNYRSHQKILEIAQNISRQIKQRLHKNFEGVEKFLMAAAKNLPPKEVVEHNSFVSDAAQYDWVSQKVKELAASGVNLNEIAILAPKHKYLTPLLPYMAAQKLPVRYEKRENILEKPLARQLEQMSRLILALSKLDQPMADALWPEVLSYDFWGLATDLIWRVSWQADAAGNGWTNALLNEDATTQIVSFFLRLKDLLPVTSLEQQLDILIGVNQADQANFRLPMQSPFFEYYFNSRRNAAEYLELLSDLSILRSHLRNWRRDEARPLNLADFINFTTEHRRSGINILNTSPYQEAESAVNIMTAYQAKGREFVAVFLLAAQDEVWGAASRDQGSTISLPANLNFIRYGGDSDDERLRLLFVAITRAKSQLYLTSYDKTLDGRSSRPLKYIIEEAALAPKESKSASASALKELEPYWHDRHMPRRDTKMEVLLRPRLDKYQFSPTDLNRFTDLIYAGPEYFFLNSILLFPRGESPRSQYGTAMHETLRWRQDRQKKTGRAPAANSVKEFFTTRLSIRKMPAQDHELLLNRGHQALSDYLDLAADDFNPQDQFEFNFKREGVFCGPAHLTGKVDKLRFDKKNKEIIVTDFKTGPSYDRWVSGNVTLHRYKQQLMVYKLLVERSHSFAGWHVNEGFLEFIEPPADENKIYRLRLDFKSEDMQQLEKLITAIWRRVQKLDLPDVSQYPKTMKGIRQFEKDLLA